MPPADSGKPKLTADQISLLRAWIDQGAMVGNESQEGRSESLVVAEPLTRPAPPRTGHPSRRLRVGPSCGLNGLSPVREADRRTHPAAVL